MNTKRALHVLVCRPDPAGSELCQQIEEMGARATLFPTIAFTEAKDQAALGRAIESIGEQDWLIFISPHAVYRSVAAIRQRWPILPPNVKFAAIGAGTAKALKEAGYLTDVTPTGEWSTEGLMAEPEFQQIRLKKVMIVRGEGGREMLEKILLERGAKVAHLIAYQRVMPEINIEPTLLLIKQQAIDVIVCGSFLAVSHLKRLLSDAWPILCTIPVIVMSERIKSLAHDLGFQTIWVAQDSLQYLRQIDKK